MWKDDMVKMTMEKENQQVQTCSNLASFFFFPEGSKHDLRASVDGRLGSQSHQMQLLDKNKLNENTLLGGAI